MSALNQITNKFITYLPNSKIIFHHAVAVPIIRGKSTRLFPTVSYSVALSIIRITRQKRRPSQERKEVTIKQSDKQKGKNEANRRVLLQTQSSARIIVNLYILKA